ncbi:MAG: hypothetical protein V2A73_21720, partial [Pseudomonadota bacterium]
MNKVSAMRRPDGKERGGPPKKDLQAAKDEAQRLATTPREVYVRDTTRDAIVTCLKMTVLMLIEYVLKEYFGG